MNFTTKISISKFTHPIDFSSKIMSLGSCFAENMGAKLDYFKFQNTSNPFGIIFNPISIEKILQRIVKKEFFTEKDIFFDNELWQCYEVHSELSNDNKEKLLHQLNALIQDSNTLISQATHLIITYGTSWVYRLKASNEVVANCHKVSQNQFEKEILSVENIEKAIQNSMDLIQQINSDCNVIFTISPVRHIKDGFVENQRSKAHLIAAIHQYISDGYSEKSHGNLKCYYFPSYEILMDELRDYRFYSQDMLHPNNVAIDYIWERFCESVITSESYTIIDEIAAIQKGLAHRSFNPNSDSHQLFLAHLNQKIAQLQQKFPFITFS